MRVNLISKWRKNGKGSVAIEFAFIGVPFILMIVGIIEMALMFTAQNLLESSVSTAAREIRTGAVQQGSGEDGFIEVLCNSASALIPCEALQYQVVAMEDFSDVGDFPAATFDENGDLEDQQFDAGGVSDVVMIRVAYRYPVKTPMMSLILSNNNDGSRVLFSTVVLQAEPYEFEDD